MNYDDLPLQVVKDLWLARFGTTVEFDRLLEIRAEECAALAGGENKNRTPINCMYRRLSDKNVINLRFVDGVTLVQWVEEVAHGPASST